MTKRFSPISFVAGFMLGTLFVSAWLFRGDFPTIALSSPAPVEDSVGIKASAPESGAISVSDQPAGAEVAVESVTVPPPGVWVAVRDVNGIELGNVLGALRVSGPRSALSIPLLRATEPGLPYAVELYRDDGSDTFDVATDSVYVDFATGAPVIARFTTN